MSTDTEQKVFEFVKKHNMIKTGDRIIAGISGGADSVCLLMLLLELKKSLKLELKVVHVHHGIRGESAERDAEFTRELCETTGTDFQLVRGDIPALARDTGTTCEEAGRNFRYETFERLAREGGFNRIAVAHNSDDNAETVLFNIFRGSGIAGVRGIRPCRRVDENLTVIRPVLCLSRPEIEEYLKERKLCWCTDETNLENGYSRNKIRNSLLPQIKEQINENAGLHIGELSLQAAELEDMLEQQVSLEVTKCRFAGEACKIDGAQLKTLHVAVKKALIRRCFGRLTGSLKDVESGHISDIIELEDKQAGKRIDLPYGMEALRDYDGLILKKRDFDLTEGIFMSDRKTNISLKVVDRKELPGTFPKNDCIQWFDYDKLNDKAVVRSRQKGDYILVGKAASKKMLNRFMIDEKISAAERDSILLLADGSHVLWIPGHRRDDSLYVTEATERVLVAEMV